MTAYSRSLLRPTFSRLCVFALAFAPVCAYGMEISPYLKFRAASHCDRKLTYAALQAEPAAAVGRIIELRGTIAGSAESDEGTLVILSLADGASINLMIPPKEVDWLRRYSNPSLRVLARIGSNPDGNVVPFEVLAIAEDSGVGQEEARTAREQAEQEAKRRSETRAQERNNARRALTSSGRGVARGDLPSRHVPARAYSGSAADNSSNPYAQFLSARALPLLPAYRRYIAAQNLNLSGTQSAQIAANLLRFADRYNVDPRLVVAMIMAESHFDPQATSRHGAMGLGQLMPGTARALGVSNAYDPVQNLEGSISYLRSRLDTFADRALPGGGITFEQVRLAMAAYNAGAGAVKKYGGVPPYRETQAYVQRIERMYRQLIRGY